MSNKYFEQMVAFGGTTVYDKPSVPDYHLMIGNSECLSQLSVQITEDMLPIYVTEPAKNLYAMSNDDIYNAIASGDLTVNDFNLNTATIFKGVEYR